MSIIIVFLFLWILSIAIATLFNEKIDVSIATSIFIIIILMFLGGMIGKLSIGFFLCVALFIFLSCYLVLTVIKNRKIKSQAILSIGFVFFVLLFIFYWIINRGIMLSSWDEFSHWGLVTKNMFYLDSFASGPEATTIFKDYPPAISLFQVFWSKLYGEFAEGNLYRSIGVLNFALILPIFKNFSLKNSKSAFFTLLLTLIIPITFFENYYSSTYVDATLGIFLFYILFTYFSDSELTLLTRLNIILALFIFPLIKSAGTGLAGVALIIILIDYIFFKRKKMSFSDGVFLLLSGLSIFGSKKLWSLYLSRLPSIGTRNISTVNLKNILKVFNGDGLDYQYQTYENFIHKVFSEPFQTSVLNMTYFYWILLVVCLGAFVLKSLKQNPDFQRLRVSFYGVLGGGWLFTLSLLLLYLFSYSENEAVNLASFERYIGTYLVSAFLFLLGLLVNHNLPWLEEKKGRQVLPVFIVIAFFLGNSDAFFGTTLLHSSNKMKAELIRAPFYPIDDIKKELKNTDRVYFISQNTSGFDAGVARYEFTPLHLNQGFTWSIGSPYGVDDLWTNQMTVAEWENQLAKDFNYVYIYKADNQFSEEFGSLFKNQSVKNLTLYHVNKTGTKVELEELSSQPK